METLGQPVDSFALRREIANFLNKAADGVPGMDQDEIARRAAWMDEDFRKIRIDPKFKEVRFPIRTGRSEVVLRSFTYDFGPNECDLDNADYGDRSHTSMSGCGLNCESILYFSKISKIGHSLIPHIWPDKMLKDLRDSNKHLNVLNEVWWLSKFKSSFVDWKNVRRNVKLRTTEDSPARNTDVDWLIPVSTGLDTVTFRVEVKRRVGDIVRRTYGTSLSPRLFQAFEPKFPEERGESDFNIGCLRLYGGITREVKIATADWLKAQTKIDALCLTSVATDKRDSFFIMTRPGAEFIKSLVEPPDHEDEMYIGTYAFPRTIEGLQLASQQSQGKKLK